MAIPVRIEAKAWTDPRYQALALELGMARARHALIAVADIWQWQTEHYSEERPTYCVPRAVIVGALEHRDGPEAMVAAGLAEEMADGTFRIRGGKDDKGKSRIDWLHRDRLAQAERGRRRADRAATEGRQSGKFTSRAPAEHQPEGVQEPAAHQPATSSPDSGLRTPDSEISLSGGARAGDPQESEPGPVDPQRGHDRLLALAEAARAKVDRARAELLTELGAPFPPSRAPELEIQSSVLAVVSGWVAADRDKDPAVAVGDRLAHLLAVRLAVARHRRNAGWWAPSTFWSADGIGKDLEYRTPADAVAALPGARPGHGARDSPRRPQLDPPRTPVSRL